MKKLSFVFLVAASTCTASAYAEPPDKRLSTMTRVAVIAIDPLEADRSVAACFVEHLPAALPLIVVTEGEADVVVKVRASVNGQSARKWGALIGGEKSVSLGTVATSAWIDGVQIWMYSSSVDAGSGRIKRTAGEDFCSLADAGINDLRKAMKKARDKK